MEECFLRRLPGLSLGGREAQSGAAAPPLVERSQFEAVWASGQDTALGRLEGHVSAGLGTP